VTNQPVQFNSIIHHKFAGSRAVRPITWRAEEHKENTSNKKRRNKTLRKIIRANRIR
jgi:hypothetical protein